MKLTIALLIVVIGLLAAWFVLQKSDARDLASCRADVATVGDAYQARLVDLERERDEIEVQVEAVTADYERLRKKLEICLGIHGELEDEGS